MSLKLYKETEVQAAAPASADPELEKLKSYVDALIKDLQDKVIIFSKALIQYTADYTRELASKENPPVAKPPLQSVPWSKHGVRGFLSKLWHGNPSQQSESTHTTLREYILIKTEVDEAADIIINELLTEAEVATNYNNQLLQIFVDFKNQLMQLIRMALEGKKGAVKSSAEQKSTDWWNANLGRLEPEKRAEILSFVDPITGQLVNPDGNNRRVIKFMDDYSLNPSNPEDIKLIWPYYKGGLEVTNSAYRGEEETPRQKVPTSAPPAELSLKPRVAGVARPTRPTGTKSRAKPKINF